MIGSRGRLLTVLLLAAPLQLACARKSPAAEPEVATVEVADVAAPQRMVVRGAVIRLRAEQPDDVVQRAVALTESTGGFVAASSTDAVGEEVQQVQATLRVPAARLGEILDALRSEGELLHQSRTGEDVTERHTDLAAQLHSKRALEQRLLALLEKAATVEDALRIEIALTETRAEIERLDATVRTLEDDVALATIELSVASPDQRDAAGAESIGSQFERAVDDAGRSLLAVLLGLIRALGVLFPLGFIGTLLGIAGRALWRAGSVKPRR